MPKDNGYCLDRCIAEEVMQLWMKGIVTTGSCCGHNKVPGYIGVDEKDIDKMKELGYVVLPNSLDASREDSFVPKSIKQKVDERQTVDKTQTLAGVAIRLAEWSLKYPRNKIGNYILY